MPGNNEKNREAHCRNGGLTPCDHVTVCHVVTQCPRDTVCHADTWHTVSVCPKCPQTLGAGLQVSALTFFGSATHSGSSGSLWGMDQATFVRHMDQEVARIRQAVGMPAPGLSLLRAPLCLPFYVPMASRWLKIKQYSAMSRGPERCSFIHSFGPRQEFLSQALFLRQKNPKKLRHFKAFFRLFNAQFSRADQGLSKHRTNVFDFARRPKIRKVESTFF